MGSIQKTLEAVTVHWDTLSCSSIFGVVGWTHTIAIGSGLQKNLRQQWSQYCTDPPRSTQFLSLLTIQLFNSKLQFSPVFHHKYHNMYSIEVRFPILLTCVKPSSPTGPQPLWVPQLVNVLRSHRRMHLHPEEHGLRRQQCYHLQRQLQCGITHVLMAAAAIIRCKEPSFVTHEKITFVY